MEKDWEKLPMYLTCKDIMTLGFRKTTIYKWFRSKGFPPVIRSDGLKVNKYKFKEWLEKQEVICCEE